MPPLDVRQITAAQTRPLRHTLLRPHQPVEKLVYPGDDHPLGFHAGAFRQHELVGIASVTPRALPGADWPEQWQLRGMATAPEVRGTGYGRALIEACLAHIAAHGGRTLWCNGRTTAIPFYQALGFQVHGEEFVVDTGPHYVLWRPVAG
jgi:GNAT superfamily N-acetyltransferase